jgi:hypothetical protein
MTPITDEEFSKLLDNTLKMEFDLLVAVLTLAGCHIATSKLALKFGALLGFDISIVATQRGWEIANLIDDAARLHGNIKSKIIITDGEYDFKTVPIVHVDICFAQNKSITGDVEFFKTIRKEINIKNSTVVLDKYSINNLYNINVRQHGNV